MASKNQEKSNYEKMWQQTFEDAEIKPPVSLWNNIDTELTRQESDKFKRRFLFYRAVAAACLLCLAGLGIYMVNDYLTHQQNDNLTDAAPADTKSAINGKQDTAKDQAESSQDLSEQKELAEKAPAAGYTAGQKAQHNTSLASNTKSKKVPPSDAKPEQETVASMLADGDTDPTMKPHLNSVVHLIASNGFSKELVKGMEWIQEIGRLYQVPNPYGVKHKQENKGKPTFFAGLDFSGNYFDPNFSTNLASDAAPAALLDRSNTYNELFKGSPENYSTSNGSAASAPGINNTPQVSLSYGASVGVNLSKQVSLESGIDYGKFNTSTETNLVLESIASKKRYPLVASNSTYAATNNVSLTSTTELTNSFELLTVPMKLGYNVRFEKVVLFISSGMAANFFIQNSISDASGKFATMNIQPDAESPYHKVFYSGVISGGINYNVSGNYFLTLSPEYSFSVTPMTNDRTFITSQPYIFGVDFGLRYEFK